VYQKLLDSVKPFKRHKQKCALASFLAQAVYTREIPKFYAILKFLFNLIDLANIANEVIALL